MKPAATIDTYRSLGRPMPTAVLAHPVAVERACSAILTAIKSGVRVLTVAGEARAEGVALAALATLASRLRRQGQTVRAVGESLLQAQAPPLPEDDVVILLEAPFYEELDSWMQPAPGQTTILAGHSREWIRAGIQPALEIEALPAEALEPARLQWRQLAETGATAAIALGLGCDLDHPLSASFPVHRASTLEPSGGYAMDTGVWIARDELARAARQPAVRQTVAALSARNPRFARAVQLWEQQCRNSSL